jgi:hypothetical protein
MPVARIESVFLSVDKERISPPSIPPVKTPITVRIRKAGIAAIAHCTIKMTIEKNGIRMSVTTTVCLFASSGIATPPLRRRARPFLGSCQGSQTRLGWRSDHCAPVHKSCSSLSRRSGRCDGRGLGDESCSVRAHRFEFFYSRFCSRFQISLNLTQSQCWEQKTLVRQRDSSLYHPLSHSVTFALIGFFELTTI